MVAGNILPVFTSKMEIHQGRAHLGHSSFYGMPVVRVSLLVRSSKEWSHATTLPVCLPAQQSCDS